LFSIHVRFNLRICNLLETANRHRSEMVDFIMRLVAQLAALGNEKGTLEAGIEKECSGNAALACVAGGYTADAVQIPAPFDPTLLTHQAGVLLFNMLKLCAF
jgi:hypothetical protein